MSKKILLFWFDIIILYISLALVTYIRYFDQFEFQFAVHVIPFSIIFTVIILVFYILNLYDSILIRNNVQFYSSLAKAMVISGVIAVSFFYLIPYFGITPKTNLFIFIAIFSGFELIYRYFFNKLNEVKFRNAIIIVGLNNLTLELAQFLKNNPQLGYELKCIIDHNSSGLDVQQASGFRITRELKQLNEMIKRDNVKIVIISPEIYKSSEVINTFYKALENKVTFRNLSSFYETVTNKVPLGAIDQIWFLENLTEGSKRSYETLKRISDVILSLILGTITIFLLPIITALIKLDSKGPIFYKQKRLGRAGNVFEMMKFRTMIVDAEKSTGAVWAYENDPRVTKIGKFLRRMRIDEIPQIWNVLKGDLSFVGPRAERPEFHDKLKEQVPFYEERYLIKPGITGWAQINFPYGASVPDSAEKLQYDLYYIKNRSFILDMGIIFKTINIALKQEGR